jgi:hypothetical protein
MEEKLLIEFLKKNLRLEIGEESMSGRIMVSVLYDGELITQDCFYQKSNDA